MGRSDFVPVGPDQAQHLELAADLARKWNQHFDADIFTVPQAVLSTTRVKSLRDPSRKMSKSDGTLDACIFVTDSPEAIQRKVLRAVTDSSDGIMFDEKNRPGISALITLFALASNTPIEQIVAAYSTEMRFAKFKADLADVLIHLLSPVRARFAEIQQNLDQVERLLLSGAEAARSIARPTLEQVKRIVMK